jgi:hypothetical protein
MDIIEVILKGLLAGLVGTVALTISETLEMKVTKRPPSDVPGQVGSKVPGVRPQSEQEMKRLSGWIHWIHGISLGALYGILSLLGLNTLATIVLFYALVWGGDALLYKALGIAEFPWRWKANEIMPDLLNKGVYAIITGLTFVLIAQ